MALCAPARWLDSTLEIRLARCIHRLTTLLGLLFAAWARKVVRPTAGAFCRATFAWPLSVLLHSYHSPRSFQRVHVVSLVPTVCWALCSCLVAMEGIICIVMAAPNRLHLAALGGWLGYVIKRRTGAAGK